MVMGVEWWWLILGNQLVNEKNKIMELVHLRNPLLLAEAQPEMNL